MKDHFKKYLDHRTNVDKRCYELWEEHKSHMQCKAGCSSCCQSFKVLPVEFEYIKSALKSAHFKVNPEVKKGECKFLVDDKCSIYEHRPVICRSHGFPLVRLNEELEEYEVSYCHLNFKTYPINSFTGDNVFFEDKFNSQLYQINSDFIQEPENKGKYSAGELVELNRADLD